MLLQLTGKYSFFFHREHTQVMYKRKRITRYNRTCLRRSLVFLVILSMAVLRASLLSFLPAWKINKIETKIGTVQQQQSVDVWQVRLRWIKRLGVDGTFLDFCFLYFVNK